MSKLSSSSSTDSGAQISNNFIAADGSTRCALCLKKNAVTSCKICIRCNQMLCKTCFKVDISKASSSQKHLFSSKQIGKCCFSDLIFQHNLLNDVTVQWGKDCLLSTRWTSSDSESENCNFFNETTSSGDDTFEISVMKSNTKYKTHPAMRLIEKDIFEDDIYARKHLSRSFQDFLNTISSNVTSDKMKQDLALLLKAFTAYFLDLHNTPEERFYHQGHGILGIFLLCFCSLKRAFQGMKDIFGLFYVDILHSDQIIKEQNFQSVVKHIVFIYLENFAQKKDPTPAFIDRLVGFSRQFLLRQYNQFFLNQLNFSSAFIIIEQLFEQRTYEVITQAMAVVIQINLKTILEADSDRINLKEVVYNKIQPELMFQYLHSNWMKLSEEAKDNILRVYYIQCEKDNKKKYHIGAAELDKSVKECLLQQKNNFKIMENHYIKEIIDLKRGLNLAIRELEIKVDQLKKMEVDKNNQILKYNTIKRKYEINEIEFEDIQNKLQFLNERAGKRQMHYNKEYEEQVANLQHQVKNYKLDFKELETLQKHKLNDMKMQLDEKDTQIKRLKEVIQFMNRTDQGGNVQQEVQDQLKSVLQEGNNDQKYQENDKSKRSLFRSYVQTSRQGSVVQSQISETPSGNDQIKGNQVNQGQRQSVELGLKQSSSITPDDKQNKLQQVESNSQSQSISIGNGKLDPQKKEEPKSNMENIKSNTDLDYQEQFNSTGTVIIKSKNQEQKEAKDSQEISQSLFEMFQSFTSFKSNNNNIQISDKQEDFSSQLYFDNRIISPQKKDPKELLSTPPHPATKNISRTQVTDQGQEYHNGNDIEINQNDILQLKMSLNSTDKQSKNNQGNRRAASQNINDIIDPKNSPQQQTISKGSLHTKAASTINIHSNHQE